MRRNGGLVVLLCILLFSENRLNAQVLTDTLNGIEIRSRRQSIAELKSTFEPGAKTVGIDSAIRNHYSLASIGNLLSQVSSVFIKSYGFNSLATLSFRGASAAQSAVYWEGIPLMNASTGIMDLSLLPVRFSDSITIQYGSSGALGGSGNVGGALMLGNRTQQFSEKNHWSGGLQAGAGSFHQFPASGEISFTGGRVAARLRGIYNQAGNDFPAKDEKDQTFTTQNAALSGEGILLDAYYKTGKKQLISFHAWQQAYSREIPRALFESVSLKNQKDNALRFLLDWQDFGNNKRSYAKLAWFREGFNYRDDAIKLKSESNTNQFFAEYGIGGTQAHDFSWLIFTPVQYSYFEGNATNARQFRPALAADLKKGFYQNALTVALNTRAELIDDRFVFLPGLGASYQVTSGFMLRASMQRSYRAPSLNELYYFPGGNQNLKPEKGWSEELGYEYLIKQSSRVSFRHSLVAYNRYIKDWIIWLGGSIWTSHNLASVHSRGLETENNLELRLGKIVMKTGFSGAYNYSTPTESYLPNDNSIGRQIPYTPHMTGSAQGTIFCKKLSLTYVENYTGIRYITSDESASLPAFFTGNLFINYTSLISKSLITVSASVQNIWNESYQVVAFRPMPGTHFLMSLAFHTQ